jgi:hypothetical protein
LNIKSTSKASKSATIPEIYDESRNLIRSGAFCSTKISLQQNYVKKKQMKKSHAKEFFLHRPVPITEALKRDILRDKAHIKST